MRITALKILHIYMKWQLVQTIILDTTKDGYCTSGFSLSLHFLTEAKGICIGKENAE